MAEEDIKLPYKLPSFHDWQPHATFYHPMYAGSIDGTDLYPHDRAVVRAILSRCKWNLPIGGKVQSVYMFFSDFLVCVWGVSGYLVENHIFYSMFHQM